MRLLLVAALLFGFLAVGIVPARAQSCLTFDFLSSPGGWSAIEPGYSVWTSSGWSYDAVVGRNGISYNFGSSYYIGSVSVTLASPLGGSLHKVLVSGNLFTLELDFGSNAFVAAPVNRYSSWLWIDPATEWQSYLMPHPSNIVAAVVCGNFPDPTATSTPTPTATGTPLPTATPLLVWLPTTDYRPICTVVSDLNLTETAVAPSPFPSLVVPTMATYVLQVPTLHVPTMVLPGAPTLTPSLSPTASETPWPTLNLPTVTPTNTRTPTPTLTCRLPDDVYPIIDVGGLVPEREPQCFRMIPLIDWDIPPINLVLFTTPEVNVHIPAVDFCVTWLPLRLSILGMDFTALLAVGLALLGARFIMGFRKEL